MSYTEHEMVCARRGAARLDTVRPDWWRWIRMPHLDMADACHCVLGQVGAHMIGTKEWDPEMPLSRVPWSVIVAETLAYDEPTDYDLITYDLGFNTEEPAHCGDPECEDCEARERTTYEGLQAAWVRIISERLHPANYAPPERRLVAVS